MELSWAVKEKQIKAPTSSNNSLAPGATFLMIFKVTLNRGCLKQEKINLYKKKTLYLCIFAL